MKSRLLRWGPVIVWAGLIFAISALPTLPKVGFIWWDFALKKSAHMIEYAIFYFLLIRAFNISSPKDRFPTTIKSRTWAIALLIGIIYALSDEYHQSFVLGRTSKLTDVGFDTLGMLISHQIMRRRLNKKSLFERSRSR